MTESLLRLQGPKWKLLAERRKVTGDAPDLLNHTAVLMELVHTMPLDYRFALWMWASGRDNI